MVDRAGLAAVPKPIGVDPEMAALRRFLPEVVTWEGTLHEGGMGPGTPAMRGIGRGTARLSRTDAGSPATTNKTSPLPTAPSC